MLGISNGEVSDCGVGAVPGKEKKMSWCLITGHVYTNGFQTAASTRHGLKIRRADAGLTSREVRTNQWKLPATDGLVFSLRGRAGLFSLRP